MSGERLASASCPTIERPGTTAWAMNPKRFVADRLDGLRPGPALCHHGATEGGAVDEAAERCLHDSLDAWADRQPDVEFAVHGSRRRTYRQARATPYQLARAFVSAGGSGGDP